MNLESSFAPKRKFKSDEFNYKITKERSLTRLRESWAVIEAHCKYYVSQESRLLKLFRKEFANQNI